MAIFTTLSLVIWFSTGTLGIFATLFYVFTMRVVIYDILSMAIITTLSTSILFCNLYYILLWIPPRSVVWSPYGYSQLCDINTHEKKLIHCMAVFSILHGNYYPPHGEFELICIGKFASRTWVNFTQQYGKNRQKCQQHNFTMLHGNYCYIFIENFPKKFAPCSNWRSISQKCQLNVDSKSTESRTKLGCSQFLQRSTLFPSVNK